MSTPPSPQGSSPEQPSAELLPSVQCAPEQDPPVPEPEKVPDTPGIEAILIQIAETLNKRPHRPRSSVVEIGTLLVAVLGLIGIVISGVGLYLTFKNAHADDQRSRELSARDDQRGRYDALSSQSFNLDSTLVEHPLLAPYFYEGKSVDDTTDYGTAKTVDALAVQRVDFFQYVYNELSNMNIAPDNGMFVLRTDDGAQNFPDDWLSWSESMVGSFRTSPAMCDEVTNSKISYSADFINALAAVKVCPGLTSF